jgi:hypothetical protein
MAQINNFRRRFRAGLASASPFTPLASQSGVPSGGLEWCGRCHDEVDTGTQAHHQGVTYSFKRSCLRCGLVLAHGVYHNVPILSDVPLPAGTMEWVTKPGVDRR